MVRSFIVFSSIVTNILSIIPDSITILIVTYNLIQSLFNAQENDKRFDK